MSTSTPTEAEMIRKAQERLSAANTAVDETRHLPPTDNRRDEAIKELELARMFAWEWMV